MHDLLQQATASCNLVLQVRNIYEGCYLNNYFCNAQYVCERCHKQLMTTCRVRILSLRV